MLATPMLDDPEADAEGGSEGEETEEAVGSVRGEG